jgi:hypothetical protein
VAVLTGRNGLFRWKGTQIGKVRSWSLDITRDALETTHLGIVDRTYVSGLRGATGSADLMYDNADTNMADLLNTIFDDANEPSASVSFVLDSAGGKSLSGTALITNVSPSVSVGEIQTISVSFQVSGSLTGGF